MADDEHKYNIPWTKLCRKEIEPEDEIDLNWQKADLAVLEEIILGTEIAEVLEKN